MAFNNQPGLPQAEKWYIGTGSLRKLLHDQAQSIFPQILNQRHDEIQQHHHFHQLNPKTNSRGYNAPKIYDVVSLNLSDYQNLTVEQTKEDSDLQQ